MPMDHLFKSCISKSPVKEKIQSGDYFGVIKVLQADLERHFSDGLWSAAVVERTLQLHNVAFRFAERLVLENRAHEAENMVENVMLSISAENEGLASFAGRALLRVLLQDVQALSLHVQKKWMQALFVLQEALASNTKLRAQVRAVAPQQQHSLDDLHAQLLCHTGVVMLAMGNNEQADVAFNEALAVCREVEMGMGEAASRGNRWWSLVGKYHRPETALHLPPSRTRSSGFQSSRRRKRATRSFLRMLELPCAPRLRHVSVLLSCLVGVSISALRLRDFDKGLRSLVIAVNISKTSSLIPQSISFLTAIYAATIKAIQTIQLRIRSLSPEKSLHGAKSLESGPPRRKKLSVIAAVDATPYSYTATKHIGMKPIPRTISMLFGEKRIAPCKWQDQVGEEN